MLKPNFRTKVLVPVILMMILLVAVTVLVVNHRITRQFLSESKNNLTTAEKVFLKLQKIRQRDLLSRFANLPNQPLYRALFLNAHDDPRTLNGVFQVLNEQGVDVVCFSTNATSVFAGQARDPLASVTAFQAVAAPAAQQALRGQAFADTTYANGRLYDVVSIPVSVDKDVIGALTIGSEVGNDDAKELSELTHAQIALLGVGKVVASTLSDGDANEQVANLFKNFSFSASDSTSNMESVVIGGNHYFGIAGKLGSLGDGQSLGYVLLSSYEDSLNTLKATQRLLVSVSLCAILFGVAVIWFLINKVTQPLRELRDSAEAVGRGDFSRRVAVHSRDECGELADAFNQMTENVQQSRAQLEKTVETLKTTQHQLIQSEKLSAVGEFVAGVAHELNNPLAAVMGFAELLRDAGMDSQYKRQLDLIYKAAQRCQKIVQSLLSFARRQQHERKPLCANELVEAVLEIVAYPLRTSNIELVLALDPQLPMVMADGHQIQQVFLNIINNARQAMEGRQTSGKIFITSTASEKSIRVTFQDNGPGISPENLRRIFDPFFTTKEVGKGTGLGLSLCYGIIKEHGGNIYAESQPGEGATFVIELPIARGVANPAVMPAPAPEKFDAKEGASKKVLVIDDEEAVLQMIGEGLRRSSFDVDMASDGETALNLIRNNNYDVTLCDWKMPGLNGQQVYERLSTIKPNLRKRVIFVTGDVINERMRQFLETENRPCLSKPFVIGDLRTAIRNVLKES
jgi:two-component system NtrC family sensor kinase